MSASEGWTGRTFEVGRRDVRHWSIEVAEAFVTAGDEAVAWFFVELDEGRIEVGVRGEQPRSWPVGSSGPASLSPALFPGEVVPAAYPELLVVGTAVVVRANRVGGVADVAGHLRTFYEVLVDDDERLEVAGAAAGWLTRVADGLGAGDDADDRGDGHARPSVADRSVIELRAALGGIRPTLDDDVEAIAARVGVEAVLVRSQLVARAAHAHLTRVWGSGSSRLRAEASLLRSIE